MSSTPEECLDSCPYNYPFYRENDKECLQYTICEEGSQKYFVDGLCVALDECISNTYNKAYIDSINICLDRCPENEVKEKLESNLGMYKCLINCGSNKFRIRGYNNDFECVDHCPK